MFTAARALLSAEKLFPRTHHGVMTQFGLHFVKKGFLDEVHAKAMNRAKERREELEYGFEGEASEEESDDALASAERFLNKVQEALRRMRGD